MEYILTQAAIDVFTSHLHIWWKGSPRYGEGQGVMEADRAHIPLARSMSIAEVADHFQAGDHDTFGFLTHLWDMDVRSRLESIQMELFGDIMEVERGHYVPQKRSLEQTQAQLATLKAFNDRKWGHRYKSQHGADPTEASWNDQLNVDARHMPISDIIGADMQNVFPCKIIPRTPWKSNNFRHG